MTERNERPSPGELVVLERLPNGLLDGLPANDQTAIREVLGKPIVLVEYDVRGRAELEFVDGVNPSIWSTHS